MRHYAACLRHCHSCSYRRSKRLLATFDFDKTIIEVDSYKALSHLLAPEQRTDQLQVLIHKSGWIVYIRRVLQLLQHRRLSAVQIGQFVRQLPAVPGMLQLMRRIGTQSSTQMCIVSDANHYFIGQWLAAHGLAEIFDAIYTNPAVVQPDGSLLVEPYEQQTHCDQCPQNLCKGGVMTRLMNDPTAQYKRIIYVGDSCNDLCAIRCLRTQDIACIRQWEELHGKLAAHRDELSCLVIHWRDGHDLEEQLFANCNSYL
ncbi:pyridoxal phosphate phosphatase PHOSPHO2 [Drosophila grimshawi]|uniref:GH24804 n=1 Tax=Drosophila grimshawi TaxID=7222 RepID=B4JNE7_DROGR|nr:pyridoxal phosphate phosphatase PHOSPHO2 [Drosophila grimshawi]EDV92240.1 GH24804 [Drosophila grimshawi]